MSFSFNSNIAQRPPSLNREDVVFLGKLINTCQTRGVIMPDGSSRGTLRTIVDWMTGKPASSYLQEVGSRIAHFSNHIFVQMPTEDQISVSNHLNSLKEKLNKKGYDLPRELDSRRGNLEHHILTNISESMFRHIHTPLSIDQQTGLENFLNQQYSGIVLRSFFERLEYCLDHRTYDRFTSEEVFIGAAMVNLRIIANLVKKDCTQTEQFLNCLQQFLVRKIFDSRGHPYRLELSEMTKQRKMYWQGLFPLVNGLIPIIERRNPNLVNQLRVQFANLPSPLQTDHEDFPHLFLSRKRQLHLLVSKLQEDENQSVDRLVPSLTGRALSVSQTDQGILKKLLGPKSQLSQENRTKIQRIITAAHLQESSSKRSWWQRTFNLSARPSLPFLTRILLRNPDMPELQTLKSLVKTKEYFVSQTNLSEEAIIIPRLYHATSTMAKLEGILTSEEVRVEHRGSYRGAWVSTQRERDYGEHVLAFGDQIQQRDLNAAIHTIPVGRRWRGLQVAIKTENIELKTQEVSTSIFGILQSAFNLMGSRRKNADIKTQKASVAIFGVPNGGSKEERTAAKATVRRILASKGYARTKVYSLSHIEFMQNVVRTTIGCPNLSDHWWGR